MAPDHSRTMVIDLMAGDPVVVSPDVPVVQVAQMLTDFDIGGLPVVDAAGRLVGVVSQTDLVRLWASSIPSSEWPALLVRDVMTRPPVTVRGSTSLKEAARLMTERDVDRLVVVGDDVETALGVISDSDLVRAFGARSAHRRASALVRQGYSSSRRACQQGGTTRGMTATRPSSAVVRPNAYRASNRLEAPGVWTGVPRLVSPLRAGGRGGGRLQASASSACL